MKKTRIKKTRTKKHNDSRLSLYTILRIGYKASKAETEYRKADKAHTDAFIEAALWKRRCEMRTLENSYYCELLEYITHYVIQATTIDELERRKAECRYARIKNLKKLCEKKKELREVVLYIKGQTNTYTVF